MYIPRTEGNCIGGHFREGLEDSKLKLLALFWGVGGIKLARDSGLKFVDIDQGAIGVELGGDGSLKFLVSGRVGHGE